MGELNISKLQKKLKYKFKKQKLLVQALTHSSYANDAKTKAIESNQRFEFLGDSLLGMTVALLIFERNKEMPEGKMSKLRADLVCEKSLAVFAEKIGIDLDDEVVVAR